MTDTATQENEQTDPKKEEGQPPAPEKTAEEIAIEAHKESGGTIIGEADGKPDDNAPGDGADTGGDDKGGSDSQTDPKSDTGSDKEDTFEDIKEGQDIPYARFKQSREQYQTIKTERDDLQAQLDSQKPQLDFVNDLTESLSANGISFEDVGQFVATMINHKQDPIAARKYHLEQAEKLADMTGDVIPADIQAKVDSGEYTEEGAREIAKARARVKLAEQNSQTSKDSADEAARNQKTNEITSAISVWMKVKENTDPDFKELSEEMERELIYRSSDTYLQKHKTTRPESPAEAEKLLNDCYEAVKERNGKGRKGKQEKPPNPTGSSGGDTPTSTPKFDENSTALDIAMATAKASGVNVI